MIIAAVMSYRIFGEMSFAMPQIRIVKDESRKLIKKQNRKQMG